MTGACASTNRSTLTEGPEGDGVAERVDARDAVLPFAAGRSAQQVRRARRQDEGRPVPTGSGRAAEPEGAGRSERDADDVAEVGPVAVPADRRAGRVFGDENVREAVRDK